MSEEKEKATVTLPQFVIRAAATNTPPKEEED